jgi:hypothetical protein
LNDFAYSTKLIYIDCQVLHPLLHRIVQSHLLSPSNAELHQATSASLGAFARPQYHPTVQCNTMIMCSASKIQSQTLHCYRDLGQYFCMQATINLSSRIDLIDGSQPRRWAAFGYRCDSTLVGLLRSLLHVFFCSLHLLFLHVYCLLLDVNFIILRFN